MKKYLFASLAAILAIFTSCSKDEYEPTTLDEIQVSSSYVSLKMDKEVNTASITVTTTDSWTLTCCDTCKVLNQNHTDAKGKAVSAKNWLSADKTSGAAGTTTITFSAPLTLDGRSTEVYIKCAGKTQHINVLQGLSVATLATCAEITAGPDSKTYRVKGTVTNLSNTTYGNYDIVDETGSVYVYGTLDKSGAEKNFSSLGIEAGDVVTVEGPKTTYNGTVELVNVSVISIEKSLLKVDSLSAEILTKEGEDVQVFLTNKGDGINVDIPEEDQDWLSVKSVKTSGTTTLVTLKAAANEGGARSSEVTFTTTKSGKTYTKTATIAQEGAVLDLTCADFNAQEDGTAQYKVHGVITKIANTKYGNLYINDGTGEVYVYGITDWNADNFKVGDEVVLQSIKTSYGGVNEMKNAVVVSQVAHEVKTVAELKAAADDKATYYLVTGKVTHAEEESAKFDLETYGNFGLQDETGTIYVYGVADALDGVTKNFAATGVKEGDTITLLAYKTSYKGTIEIVGKFIKKESAE